MKQASVMQDCLISHEEARLGALQAFEVLDTAPEEAFDRITRLAKLVLNMPIVLVSLVDRDRQWFKSRQGIDVTEEPRDTSFCTHTIRQDDPMIVPDATLDPRFANSPAVTGAPHVRFYIGVPLKNRDGFNIGALCCLDYVPRIVAVEQIAILQDLARLVIDELELRLLATVDSLTGSMMRRAFRTAAERDLELSRRHDRPLSCIMLDADHFKSVNDLNGHAVGDQVLRQIVGVCRSQMRLSDYIGRLGGEEFAIILRETDVEQAFPMAERLRTMIEHEVIITPRGPLSVTVSAGLASREAGVADIDQLLGHADAALYSAKASGRNRTISYQSIRPAARLRA